ncbi:MAG TPA: hypothetical protein VGM39_12825, partial [Kofleriaceae bacterium]
EQVKVFRQIKPLDADDFVRGQFAGYRDEEGVDKKSTVETFAAVRLEVDSWRWWGVPWLIRAGKCMPVTTTEIYVQLKRPPLSQMVGDGNYVRLRLSPDVEIAIGAQVKKPGDGMIGEPTELSFVHKASTDEMTPYERLLGDAMDGDAQLFAREDGVEEAWEIVEPVLNDAVPVYEYAKGTWGPHEAEQLAKSVGGWHDPVVRSK